MMGNSVRQGFSLVIVHERSKDHVIYSPHVHNPQHRRYSQSESLMCGGQIIFAFGWPTHCWVTHGHSCMPLWRIHASLKNEDQIKGVKFLVELSVICQAKQYNIDWILLKFMQYEINFSKFRFQIIFEN